MSNEVHESWRRRGPGTAGAAPSAADAGGAVVDLDVSWLVPADLDAVDALARLQVAVSQCGRRLLLHGVNGGLAELLEFVGLSEFVRVCPDCRSSAECDETAGARRGIRPEHPGDRRLSRNAAVAAGGWVGAANASHSNHERLGRSERRNPKEGP
jgi:ABC-type transporter Mla MlaB component